MEGRNQQAVDLLVGVIGQREHDPVRPRPGFARPDGDAPDDAVGTRRGRDLDDVAIRLVALDHVGEIEHWHVERHALCLDRQRRPQQRKQHQHQEAEDGDAGPEETWCR